VISARPYLGSAACVLQSGYPPGLKFKFARAAAAPAAPAAPALDDVHLAASRSALRRPWRDGI